MMDTSGWIIFSRKSDWIFTAVIGIMAVWIFILWNERRKLHNHRREDSGIPLRQQIQQVLGEMKRRVVVDPDNPRRFRKRDKFYFYGRRMMRKVAYASSQESRRRAVTRLSRQFLRYDSDDDSSSSSVVSGTIGPAEEEFYDDETSPERNPDDISIPETLSLFLHGFHIFGNFDKTLFLDLADRIQSVIVPANQYLYHIGDPDDAVYVLINGSLHVYISADHEQQQQRRDNDNDNNDQSQILIKTVHPSETASSFLSFIDAVTGHPSSVYKTVCCKAIMDSTVLKVSISDFLEILSPDILTRVVQLTMARCQRVIFVALHQYLGLTSELIRRPRRINTNEKIRENEYSLEDAVSAFELELDYHDLDFLRRHLVIRSINIGDCVTMTEDSHNVGLIYIMSGTLVMSMNSIDLHRQLSTLYTAYPGDIVGQLAVLTGETHFYTASESTTSTKVAILTKDILFLMIKETPTERIVLRLAHNTILALSPLVRQVDFALDWINIESGKALYRQFDKTDAMFIVLSGRLRSFIDVETVRKRKQTSTAEYSRGDMVGLVDVITSEDRHQSVMAVRDSELCKVPSHLLNYLKVRYPVVVSRLIHLLGHKLIGTWIQGGNKEMESETSRFTTVALFAGSQHVPISAFGYELTNALTAFGPVCRLSSSVIYDKFGQCAFDSNQEFRLNAWLGQQEDLHDVNAQVVIYQCDYEMTTWTSRCLRQADVIFDLVLAYQDTEVTDQEKELEFGARRVRKELILIHKENVTCPSGTRFWLKKRPWISSHFHLQAPSRQFFTRRNERKIADFYERRHTPPNIHSDFSRLSRHIIGASVGLVLGGGGARGAAHVGMIKAIRETGIPVDKIGGVSIGCFIGGLWCSERDVSTMIRRARDYFHILGYGIIKPLLDITYPHTSVFTGAHFNQTLMDAFGQDLYIEDLWLPFYCVTTDITCSRERIHTKGIFWKYCRASMSYAWLLPPLCDPMDGHLLMDGCYVNNVPGDVMQNCKYILAIDVGTMDDRNLCDYGDTLSGWWVLLKRLNPFGKPVKIPDQSEIQMRLAFCSHYKNLEKLKNNPNYEYIPLPIDKYSPGSFKLYDEILEVGYHHGKTYFMGLQKAGNDTTHGHSPPPWLPTAGPGHHKQWDKHRRQHSGLNSESRTFTDLAGISASKPSTSTALLPYRPGTILPYKDPQKLRADHY